MTSWRLVFVARKAVLQGDHWVQQVTGAHSYKRQMMLLSTCQERQETASSISAISVPAEKETWI